MKYAHITGWGHYLPSRVLTNDELAQSVDTSDEWIMRRTGIRQRHIADARETTATLAYQAAIRALHVAKVSPAQLDLIVVATATPDYMFPSTASLVQDYLGAGRAGAFDLSAACSGFVYALSLAGQSIATGAIETALVIGAETMSRVLNWEDRGTCVLFGDGAGAVVLQGSTMPGGLLASKLRSDGSGSDLLKLPAVYQNPVPTLAPEYYVNGHHSNTVSMNGRQVFRFASRVVADVVEEVVEDAGLRLDDIALIVPHQANVRIIESAAKRLKIGTDRFYVNVADTGNTSAASIPIALCQAAEDNRLKPDDNIVLVGFGGGLTWAATVLKWDVTPEGRRLHRRAQQTRFAVARARSQLRRLGRSMGARLAGSPTPDARLRDADRSRDDRSE